MMKDYRHFSTERRIFSFAKYSHPSRKTFEMMNSFIFFKKFFMFFKKDCNVARRVTGPPSVAIFEGMII